MTENAALQAVTPAPGGAAFSGYTASPVSRRSYVPLSQLAEVRVVPGPPMISSENAQLRSIVFLNVRGRDMGSFVNEAKEVLEKELRLPPGYTVQWSGQWENQIRAKKRFEVLMPVVFLVIFVMLYFTTKDFTEAFVVMLSVPFALIGGIYLIYILGYNFSVAVWVGFIALYGVAVQTGLVMVVYLHEALDRKLRAHQRRDLDEVAFEDRQLASIRQQALRPARGRLQRGWPAGHCWYRPGNQHVLRAREHLRQREHGSLARHDRCVLGAGRRQRDVHGDRHE